MADGKSINHKLTSSNQLCYIEKKKKDYGGTFISYKRYRTGRKTLF